MKRDESGNQEDRKSILDVGGGAPAVFVALLIAIVIQMYCAG